MIKNADAAETSRNNSGINFENDCPTITPTKLASTRAAEDPINTAIG